MTDLLTDAAALSLAKELCNLGIDRDTEQRHFEAITSYDAVVAQFGQRRKPEFTEIVAKAMYNKGCALVTLGADIEAIAAFDVLIKKFEAHSESAVCVQVVKALMNKGHRLGAHKRSEASIACYETVVAQYSESQDPKIEPLVAAAQDFLQERSRILSSQTKTT